MKDRSNYDVGYGKPPEHGKFKPGQSGNPRGRKKEKSYASFNDLIRQELVSLHKLQINGKTKNFRAVDIIVKRIVGQSMKGEFRFVKLMMETPAFREILERPEGRPLNGAEKKLIDDVFQQARDLAAKYNKKEFPF